MHEPSFLIQPPNRFGDTTWMTWSASGVRTQRPGSRIYCELASPFSTLVAPTVADTDLRRAPKGFDFAVGFEGASAVLERGTTGIPIPRIQFYRSREVTGVEGTSHFQQTGRRHVLEVVEHSLQRRLAEYRLPPRSLMPEVADDARSLLSNSHDGAVVTINIGARRTERLYPLERWIAVAGELARRDFKVALIGCHDDVDTWRALLARQSLLSDGRCFDFVGKLPLVKSMGLIATSAVHLSTDTGTGHIAAAYGVPTVTLFGQMTISEVCRPFGDRAYVLQAESWTPDTIHVADVVRAVVRQSQEGKS